jgi:arsenate reductase (glutaredoxin)
MQNITVYGIPNCNSVKKALEWFSSNKMNVTFHNFKKNGISKQKLTEWCKLAGWENLLNRKGTTWRSVSVDDQKKITNQSTAILLMMDKTSVIKRPVVEYKDQLLVGFDEQKFTAVFL